MNQENSGKRYYRRFSQGQLYLHGLVMATFLGLALTGMILRFSHASWAEAFARGLGGFSAILFFHKFCAVLLSLGFLAHLGNVAYRGLVRGQTDLFWGPNSMVPQWKDFQDLYQHFRWFLWRGPQPKFDRFAYWEKFDYWAVFWGMFIIGISGYMLWFSRFFAKFVPGSWLNIALLIHGEEALLAVWFIFAIHFFNTHLRPGSFPMDLVIFTGRETVRELEERRTAQYERMLATGELRGAAEAAAPSSDLKVFARIVGSVVILCGFVLLFLTLASFLKGG